MTDSEKLDLILSKLSIMDRRFDAVDRRFDAVAQRFDAVDQRFDAVDQNIKAAKSELYDEIVRAEKAIDDNASAIKDLTVKYDTLLLKADNTDLLLRLVNRQADEMDGLKARIDALEKKLA